MYMIESGSPYAVRRYVVNNDGMITRFNHSIPYEQHNFSGDWKVSGIREILPFGNIGRRISIKEAAEKINKFTFKNGNGKYLLEDVDHGTTRIWGDRIIKIFTITR